RLTNQAERTRPASIASGSMILLKPIASHRAHHWGRKYQIRVAALFWRPCGRRPRIGQNLGSTRQGTDQIQAGHKNAYGAIPKAKDHQEASREVFRGGLLGPFELCLRWPAAKLPSATG